MEQKKHFHHPWPGGGNLRGADPKRRPVNATWLAPENFEHDQIDPLMGRPTEGASLTLDGY